MVFFRSYFLCFCYFFFSLFFAFLNSWRFELSEINSLGDIYFTFIYGTLCYLWFDLWSINVKRKTDPSLSTNFYFFYSLNWKWKKIFDSTSSRNRSKYFVVFLFNKMAKFERCVAASLCYLCEQFEHEKFTTTLSFIFMEEEKRRTFKHEIDQIWIYLIPINWILFFFIWSYFR